MLYAKNCNLKKDALLLINKTSEETTSNNICDPTYRIRNVFHKFELKFVEEYIISGNNRKITTLQDKQYNTINKIQRDLSESIRNNFNFKLKLLIMLLLT